MTERLETTESQGHERRDVDVVSLLLIGVIVLFIGALALGSSWALMHLFNRRYTAHEKPPVTMSPDRQKFPAPRLLQDSGVDYAGLLKQQEAELHSYGWVDRPAGKVRIPVERAMQLLLERGLPEVGTGLTPLQMMQQRPQTNETPSSIPGAPNE